MRKLLLASIIVLAGLSPLAANTLVGFGFTFSGDIVDTRVSNLLFTTETVSTYTGIGMNADLYVGQKLGFYAGGAFGLLTGASSQTTIGSYSQKGDADMEALATKLYGNALLGLGIFLPLGGFDISGALGFGLDFLTTRASGSDAAFSMATLGPGLALGLGVPVSTQVEAYLSCRLVYGMVRLGDQPEGYRNDFSFAPAIGIRIKA
jgi:hypothetical protein